MPVQTNHTPDWEYWAQESAKTDPGCAAKVLQIVGAESAIQDQVQSNNFFKVRMFRLAAYDDRTVENNGRQLPATTQFLKEIPWFFPLLHLWLRQHRTNLWCFANTQLHLRHCAQLFLADIFGR